MTMEAAHTSIWTRAYVLLCAAVFMSSAHYSVLFVAIPLYVTHLGGSPFLAGLVLLTFSLPSFTLRPFIGYWADSWNTVGVLTIGALLLGLSGFFYLIPAMVVLFVASAFRGLGWAGLMTGGYTILAHITPASRRGEASGYYTSLTGTASIAFPALALWLIDKPSGGFRIIFVLGGAFALTSVAIGLLGLRRVVHIAPVLRKQRSGGLGSLGAVLLDRDVLLATTLSFCVMLAQPAVTAFLPLYAKKQGIHNIGYFYILAGITSLLIRPLVGRAADRVGRGISIAAGLLVQIAGLASIMLFGTLPAILVGGVFNAIGTSINSAATMALAMDLANPERRGTSMATFSLSIQMGMGVGAVLAGALVSLSGYRGMYLGSILVLVIGLVLTLLNWSKLARVIAPPLLTEAGMGSAIPVRTADSTSTA
ncbi:MAG: MFS transporter [Dehalococcoidia bacterium]